jgi:hypothetical protein
MQLRRNNLHLACSEITSSQAKTRELPPHDPLFIYQSLLGKELFLATDQICYLLNQS